MSGPCEAWLFRPFRPRPARWSLGLGSARAPSSSHVSRVLPTGKDTAASLPGGMLTVPPHLSASRFSFSPKCPQQGSGWGPSAGQGHPQGFFSQPSCVAPGKAERGSLAPLCGAASPITDGLQTARVCEGGTGQPVPASSQETCGSTRVLGTM